jgi:hypothetical protein
MRFAFVVVFVAVARPGLAELRLGVDWNGDGLIQIAPHPRIPVDAPTESQPFTFWINHDQDDIETGGETWPIERADGDTPPTDSLRDLEDFARLVVHVDGLDSWRGSAQLELSWRDGSGARVNLYRATDQTCSRSYLLDEAAAQAQLGGQSAGIGTVGEGPLRMTLADLGAPDMDGIGYCFLFDVAEGGRDALQARIVDGDESVAAKPLPMDLRHVKTMYQRTTMTWPEAVKSPWEYRDRDPEIPDLRWRHDPQGYPFEPGWYETQDTVVWVYGWLRSGEGLYEMATTQAGETIFKRLWHRGYRGRLAFFHWPTVKPRLAYGFLESEYRAYKSAPALVDFVRTFADDKRVHVTAHSLGCVVLTEALKLGLEAESALLQVGAIPAAAYDTRDVLNLRDMVDVETPTLASEGGYLGYIEQTRTPVYTMYNYADATFFGWNIAQKQMKPTSKRGGYRYVWKANAPPGKRARLYYDTSWFTSDYRIVTDPHEIMAFVAKSKTHAIGAETRVSGHVRHVFDLARSPFEFHTGHVVGWTRGVQQTTAFYNLLLDVWNVAYISELI